MNILLVDDDKDPRFERNMRFMVETHFKKRGIRLYFVSTLADGLAEVKRDRTIKLVLCDLSMPCVGTPQETIDRWLPKLKEFAHVAFFTGYDEDDLRRSAMARGAIGFISKAEKPEEQLAQIDELVRQIAGAHIRIETEEQEGKVLTTRRAAKLGLPVMVGVIVGVLTIGGITSGYALGFWRAAESKGAERQALADRLDKQEEKLKAHDKQLDDMQRTLRRLEIGNRLLLQHVGITAPRDGE